MSHAGVAFMDSGTLAGASFPNMMGIEEQELFSQSDMRQYC